MAAGPSGHFWFSHPARTGEHGVRAADAEPDPARAIGPQKNRAKRGPIHL